MPQNLRTTWFYLNCNACILTSALTYFTPAKCQKKRFGYSKIVVLCLLSFCHSLFCNIIKFSADYKTFLEFFALSSSMNSCWTSIYQYLKQNPSIGIGKHRSALRLKYFKILLTLHRSAAGVTGSSLATSGAQNSGVAYLTCSFRFGL